MTAIMKSEPTPSDREVLTGLVERVTYQNAREWLLRPAGQGPWPMYFGIRDREDGFRIQNAASYRWTKGHANGIEEAGSPSPPREWLLRPAGQRPGPMYFGIRDREDGFRIQNAASYRWTKGHANGIEEAGSPSP